MKKTFKKIIIAGLMLFIILISANQSITSNAQRNIEKNNNSIAYPSNQAETILQKTNSTSLITSSTPQMAIYQSNNSNSIFWYTYNMSQYPRFDLGGPDGLINAASGFTIENNVNLTEDGSGDLTPFQYSTTTSGVGNLQDADLKWANNTEFILSFNMDTISQGPVGSTLQLFFQDPNNDNGQYLGVSLNSSGIMLGYTNWNSYYLHYAMSLSGAVTFQMMFTTNNVTQDSYLMSVYDDADAFTSFNLTTTDRFHYTDPSQHYLTTFSIQPYVTSSIPFKMYGCFMAPQADPNYFGYSWDNSNFQNTHNYNYLSLNCSGSPEINPSMLQKFENLTLSSSIADSVNSWFEIDWINGTNQDFPPSTGNYNPGSTYSKTFTSTQLSNINSIYLIGPYINDIEKVVGSNGTTIGISSFNLTINYIDRVISCNFQSISNENKVIYFNGIDQQNSYITVKFFDNFTNVPINNLTFEFIQISQSYGSNCFTEKTDPFGNCLIELDNNFLQNSSEFIFIIPSTSNSPAETIYYNYTLENYPELVYDVPNFHLESVNSSLISSNAETTFSDYGGWLSHADFQYESYNSSQTWLCLTLNFENSTPVTQFDTINFHLTVLAGDAANQRKNTYNILRYIYLSDFNLIPTANGFSITMYIHVSFDALNPGVQITYSSFDYTLNHYYTLSNNQMIQLNPSTNSGDIQYISNTVYWYDYIKILMNSFLFLLPFLTLAFVSLLLLISRALTRRKFEKIDKIVNKADQSGLPVEIVSYFAQVKDKLSKKIKPKRNKKSALPNALTIGQQVIGKNQRRRFYIKDAVFSRYKKIKAIFTSIVLFISIFAFINSLSMCFTNHMFLFISSPPVTNAIILSVLYLVLFSIVVKISLNIQKPPKIRFETFIKLIKKSYKTDPNVFLAITDGNFNQIIRNAEKDHEKFAYKLGNVWNEMKNDAIKLRNLIENSKRTIEVLRD